MDSTRFDALTRVFAVTRSRRGIALTVGSLLLGSGRDLLLPANAEAKKKKKRRKKRKKRAAEMLPPPANPPPNPCADVPEWTGCGDGLFCQGGACLSGAGSCPEGADSCIPDCPGNDCQCGPGSCLCYQTRTGVTRCGTNQGSACDDCEDDENCVALHGLGAFCVARNEVVCSGEGCPGNPINMCVKPCAS